MWQPFLSTALYNSLCVCSPPEQCFLNTRYCVFMIQIYNFLCCNSSQHPWSGEQGHLRSLQWPWHWTSRAGRRPHRVKICTPLPSFSPFNTYIISLPQCTTVRIKIGCIVFENIIIPSFSSIIFISLWSLLSFIITHYNIIITLI